MKEWLDYTVKTLKWIFLIWFAFTLGSIVLVLLPWDEDLSQLTDRIPSFYLILQYREDLIVNAAAEVEGEHLSWAEVVLLSSRCFAQYLREIFVFIFLYQWMLENTVIYFQVPPWLKELFPTYFSLNDALGLAAHPGGSEDNDDENMPPLEEVSNGSLKDELEKEKEWYVFHPVFGVIPSETRDLWTKQEIEREERRQQLLLARQKPPPVRFSNEEDEGIDCTDGRAKDHEDADRYLEQIIPIERTISGFDAVGIE